MFMRLSVVPDSNRSRMPTTQDAVLMRYRYYDENIGRFTSFDSFEGSLNHPLSLNKYIYANADPISHTDRTGHMADDVEVMGVIAIAAVIIGLGVAQSVRTNRLARWLEMQGIGTWDADTFFKYGMRQNTYISGWNNLVGVYVPTDVAYTYAKACYGLLTLRLGVYPYDRRNHFFTDLGDAKNFANQLGADARIFAIQFDGEKDFDAVPSTYRSEVRPRKIH